MPELLSKITLKKCLGDLKARVYATAPKDDKGMPKNGVKIPLLRVAGRCNAASVEESDLGPFVKLRGQFRAICLQPDENGVLQEFMSAQCILPEVAALPLYELMYTAGTPDELSDAEKSGKDSQGRPKRSRVTSRVRISESLDFAYDITVTVDMSTAVGYTYSATPLMEPTEDDPVQRIMSSLPKLPAPATARLENKGKAAKA